MQLLSLFYGFTGTSTVPRLQLSVWTYPMDSGNLESSNISQHATRNVFHVLYSLTCCFHMCGPRCTTIKHAGIMRNVIKRTCEFVEICRDHSNEATPSSEYINSLALYTNVRRVPNNYSSVRRFIVAWLPCEGRRRALSGHAYYEFVSHVHTYMKLSYEHVS